MKAVEESVVTAMDGSDVELFRYLPYIMQDIWEFGADPKVMIDLISKHQVQNEQVKVLDLGCGKGAVSVQAAKTLGCSCLGIDAVPGFIEYAKEKAREYGVESRCTFEVADIRERVKSLSGFDVVILGAIGPVFGDYFTTLTSLKDCLKKDGVFLIDDGFIDDDSSFQHPLMLTKKQIEQQIEAAGMELLEIDPADRDDIVESDDFIFDRIKARCEELMAQHPEKAQLFRNYIRNQETENDVLENKIVGATLVVRMRK